MLIPRFWASATGIASHAEGGEYDLRAWGCSPTSTAEAQADADARLASWIRRISSGDELGTGQYAYTRAVIREALLHEFRDTVGDTIAMITRNRYGALVLNTTRLLFIDVDLPADTVTRRVFTLFKGKDQSVEEQTLDRLRGALRSHPDTSFRIYRTAAGFRALATNRQFGPTDAQTVALMKAAGADRAYMNLCRAQSCFRARLTPKPWRIGQTTPTLKYPYLSAEIEASSVAWIKEYEVAIAEYATCTLVETLGSGEIAPEASDLVTFHDTASRVGSGLELA